MALLILNEKCLVLHHENISMCSKHLKRLENKKEIRGKNQCILRTSRFFTSGFPGRDRGDPELRIAKGSRKRPGCSDYF